MHEQKVQQLLNQEPPGGTYSAGTLAHSCHIEAKIRAKQKHKQHRSSRQNLQSSPSNTEVCEATGL